MRLRNSFWALLGHNVEVVPTKVLEAVRLAMLVAIDEHCGSGVHCLDDKINFAKTLDTLWYLRAELLEAISKNKGEAFANEALAKITQLFKGYEPDRHAAQSPASPENQPTESAADDAMSMAWNDAYKIGDAVIDEQHETWFERINSFLDASDKKSLMLCEMQMLQYTRVHFENEEALMFLIHYPEYAEHVKQHNQILDTLHKISGQIAADTLDRNVWKSFLSVWLLDHIRVQDTKLAEYVGKK